jgi:hypothetical protein
LFRLKNCIFKLKEAPNQDAKTEVAEYFLQEKLNELESKSVLNFEDSEEIATCLKEVAKAYNMNGNFEKEIEYARKSYEMFTRMYSEENVYLAECLLQIGSAYGCLKNCNKEIEFKLKAIQSYDRLNMCSCSFISNCLKELVTRDIDYDLKGDLSLKLKCSEMFKRLYLGDNPLVAHSLTRVANSYYNLCNFNKALEFNLKSVDMFARLGITDSKDLAYCFSCTGCAYGQLGDSGKELNYKLKAYDIYEKLGMEPNKELAFCLNEIGRSYSRNDNVEMELEFTLKAYRAYKKLRMGNLNIKHTTKVVLKNIYFSRFFTQNHEKSLRL